MIPFDAPFVPDDNADRLNPDGSRNMTNLIAPVRDATGKIVGYEVNF